MFACCECGEQRKYGFDVPLTVDFERHPFIRCDHCDGLRPHDFLRRGWPKNGAKVQQAEALAREAVETSK